MKTSLPMDFTVDAEKSTVYVKRAFNAPVETVWSAWTKPEILDKWWAPKPWISKTKSMEFKVGGRRLYAMCGPDGEEHWAFAEYTAIEPKTYFQHRDGFCDSNGTITTDLPQSVWDVDFSPKKGITLVSIAIKHETLEDLEKIIAMGFKEGFTSAMEGLDTVLSA